MQISTQKKKTCVIAPKRFVQRVKKENELLHGFMHQDAHEFSFSFVCVSIGLTIEKLPVVGVVYNPIMNELFTAIHGLGAFLNGKPIKVSSQSQLVTCLLTTEVIRILPYSAVQLFAYESYKVSKNYSLIIFVELGDVNSDSSVIFNHLLQSNIGLMLL